MTLKPPLLLANPRLRMAMLLLALAAVLALSWTRVLDQPAADYLDATLKRTLVTFAVARALNGSISMLQDVDLSVSPIGVGVTLSPGELLDPINDLIEQFSSILLLASISLGMQKILLTVSNAGLVSALLSGVLVLACLVHWRARSPIWRRQLARLAALLLLLRFFVPVYALASQQLDRQFLQPSLLEASAALDLSREVAQAATQDPVVPATPPASVSQRLADWFRETGATIDIRARIQRLLNQLGALSEHIVTLSVVFLLQSVGLPLFFLSLAGFALRSIWQIGADVPEP